jgi:hypothetical protein
VLWCLDCTGLNSFPDLPVCYELDCSGCTSLTYINVPDGCVVTCDNSPIAGYNNDLYLSYINLRSNVIRSTMNTSDNYEPGIIAIIESYM